GQTNPAARARADRASRRYSASCRSWPYRRWSCHWCCLRCCRCHCRTPTGQEQASLLPRLRRRPSVMSALLPLMSKDLRKEIPGAVGPRLGEELARCAVLENLAIGHERDPVGGVTREAHLVRHHDHRHAFLAEADHDVE